MTLSKADKAFLFIVIAIAFLLWLGIIMVLLGIQIALPVAPAPAQAAGGGGAQLTPTVEITLYAGKTPDGQLGFGFSPDEITSPGPVINVKSGDVVKITLINIDTIPHAFAVVPTVKPVGPEVLFNSQITTPTKPLAPGKSESVIFVAESPGEYFYQCPVANHAPQGMWGKFVVSG